MKKKKKKSHRCYFLNFIHVLDKMWHKVCPDAQRSPLTPVNERISFDIQKEQHVHTLL